jgi:hypothetical protein
VICAKWAAVLLIAILEPSTMFSLSLPARVRRSTTLYEPARTRRRCGEQRAEG